jgi:hypothetical protein
MRLGCLTALGSVTTVWRFCRKVKALADRLYVTRTPATYYWMPRNMVELLRALHPGRLRLWVSFRAHSRFACGGRVVYIEDVWTPYLWAHNGARPV